VQKEAGEIGYNFSCGERRELCNCGQIIGENCWQKQNVSASKFFMGQISVGYNKLRAKAVQQVYVVFDGLFIQPKTAKTSNCT
jgi:hypothetical protein